MKKTEPKSVPNNESAAVREARENIKRKQALIEKGKQFIYKERHAEWEERIKKDTKEAKDPDELKSSVSYLLKMWEEALAVIEALEEGKTKEEINKIIKLQNQSGASEFNILCIVTDFSKKGVEFAKNPVHWSEKTGVRHEELLKHLEKLEKENAEYAQNEADELKAQNASQSGV